jgi:hypothetical protein
MAKVLHLSKLSRGHVELSESGSRLEIFADKTVRSFILLNNNNNKKNNFFYILNILGKTTCSYFKT